MRWSVTASQKPYGGQTSPGSASSIGLLAGERILEIIHRPGARFLIRESLVEGYGGLRQDILNYVGRDTLVNLHARYWRRQ
ncbi:MAG: hypothetical protein EBS89_14945 [Proteobacteria bacterium]|nr:hypothetical protein [Pseudomonadota bacterium]